MTRLVSIITAIGLLLGLTRSAPAQTEPMQEASRGADEAFFEDLSALTRHEHRLSGTPFGAAAALYIEQRLRALGLSEIFELDMPVWQPRTVRCELEVAGHSVRLLPLRPNLLVSPVTPIGGLEAPLIFAGKGRLWDYAARDPRGAIVVLDYDSADAWERAFALGAKAVVFVGNGDETPLHPKRANVPANQLRFYVPEQSLGGLDRSRDYPSARLVSEVPWQEGLGRNIVARLRGTDPGFSKVREGREALVLATNYDSYGEVPEASAGARGAANVAALLEAVARFERAPPKRDVVFMFLDNQARAHQGAQAVYAALELPADEVERLLTQVDAERTHVRLMRDLLEREGIAFGRNTPLAAAGLTVSEWLRRVLADEADAAAAEVRRDAALGRLSQPASGKEHSLAWHDARALGWDQIRRVLFEDRLADFFREQFRLGAQSGAASEQAKSYLAMLDELSARAQEHFSRRLAELDRDVAIAKQRLALRQGLGFSEGPGGTHAVLHASYDFADQGASWGVVAGDWTYALYPWRTQKTEADKPGYYNRVLSALGEARPAGPSALEPRTLREASLGVSFAARPFFSSGAIAGSYGVHHLAFMTGYDGRWRDGHPADSLERLDWRRLMHQAREATELLHGAASRESLSVAPVFSPLAKSRFPSWERGRASGDYAGLTVSGALSEDRPARGALVALWPGSAAANSPWSALERATGFSNFDPIAIEGVDGNGRFELVGMREDIHQELMLLGAAFDAWGRVRAVTTSDSVLQKLSDAMRVNLFFAAGGSWSQVTALDQGPWGMRLLKASSDAAFRETRVLSGQSGSHGFYYVSSEASEALLKLFQPRGAVLLGKFDAAHPTGAGVAPAAFQAGLELSRSTAEDLWQLNESRFATLRSRGVTSADLEGLHARARRYSDSAANSKSLAEREARLAKSAAFSQRVYQPLRESMDDLVHAIVVLLLLTIPFAFALERLVIGASSIYGRIAGFAALFLVTFALLYWLHPGFAVASTPIIILLAFAIVLLSALVIFIVVRKFEAELQKMRGEGALLHAIEVSKAHTLLAAVNLGMSTMRRRPTRTILTTLTVVVLTFTILSFASFTRNLGVRSIYEGPLAPDSPRGIFVRKLDYSPLEPGLCDMLAPGEAGGFLAPHYWYLRLTADAPRLSVTRVDTGKSLNVEAILGIDPGELAAWPALGRGLGSESSEQAREALARGDVYLPAIVKDLLELEPGDEVLLAGRPARFAGTTLAAELARLSALDKQSPLPVDFQDPASSEALASRTTEPEVAADDVVRDFVHLSSDQVVVASAEFARQLGGQMHSLSYYPASGVEPLAEARALAELTALPVWAAGPDGIEREILTLLAEVSGGAELFVPLLLGGLIIFGTLLGSISDREKEIYTFSALGLSPGHVGILFFAEASVYAILGGVGGQLLAQLVGRAVVHLSQSGVLPPTSLNYSSTNSLFAICIVMLTVLVSAIYPALRASKSANPGLARAWRMPPAEGDELRLTFPFTVSAYDITGVVSFLAEHFRHHEDAGLGNFAAQNVVISQNAAGNLELSAELALAPFDLGVTETLVLTAIPSQIRGVDEVAVHVKRLSGAHSDWYRANRTFMRDLRRQFLLWRTLAHDVIEQYRLRTLELLGDAEASSSEFAPERSDAVPILARRPAGTDRDQDSEKA